jgi:L-ascorbate metabolism protein UlaG (beta-lactamase superfamily)
MSQVFLFIGLGILLIIMIGYFLSGPKYQGEVTNHFNGKRFINPGNVKAKGLTAVFRWLFTRKRTSWGKFLDDPYGEKPAARIDSGIRITFINHSCFLIQTNGLNILTDPIYSERASPFSWSGPKRMRNPGVRYEDLPHIDVVLISHNHYDHLDMATLKKIAAQCHPRIFAALGIGKFLRSHGISSITEMDWWSENWINDVAEIAAVPAQHFSGRGMFDRDATLWVGFVIRVKEGNIYFAADTGYNDETFVEIGKHFSPIRVSILPIGAYRPRWFMSPIHCSPHEAVIMHKALESKLSIGSHFGTFPLADEGRDEPVIDLKKAMQEENISPNDFITLKEGTFIEI